MGLEIERKFLVVNDAWRVNAVGVRYRQGYLSTVPERTVRVRTVGNQGFLTIKGITQGAARREYEYEIPLGDANEMLDGLCERPLIEKVRYKIPYGGLLWELDEFEGDNAGLLMAEVELTSADQAVELPAWAGREVTGEAQYYNANLIANPFSRW
jgi:CYTH domain-containing protein